jgi:LPXTG-site transpeptidase (sortase) family protein
VAARPRPSLPLNVFTVRQVPWAGPVYNLNPMPNFSRLRLVSWLLMGIALSLLINVGSSAAYLASAQGELTSAWDQSHHAAATTPVRVPTSGGDFGNVFQVQRPRLAIGQPLAKMTVPAANGWSGVILEGNDDQVLSGGPGHQVGTAYPGEADNMVISNHNTYSMQFANLKVGDEILLDTDYGHFVYRITGFQKVAASDRSPTARTDHAVLTFTTCFPLWAGAFATQRYIIRADQVNR